MYCLLPVVTAVPEGKFLCPRCETGEMPRRELTKHAVKTQCSRIRAAMRAVERGEEPPVWPEPKAKSKETAICKPVPVQLPPSLCDGCGSENMLGKRGGCDSGSSALSPLLLLAPDSFTDQC